MYIMRKGWEIYQDTSDGCVMQGHVSQNINVHNEHTLLLQVSCVVTKLKTMQKHWWMKSHALGGKSQWSHTATETHKPVHYIRTRAFWINYVLKDCLYKISLYVYRDDSGFRTCISKSLISVLIPNLFWNQYCESGISIEILIHVHMVCNPYHWSYMMLTHICLSQVICPKISAFQQWPTMYPTSVRYHRQYIPLCLSSNLINWNQFWTTCSIDFKSCLLVRIVHPPAVWGLDQLANSEPKKKRKHYQYWWLRVWIWQGQRINATLLLSW